MRLLDLLIATLIVVPWLGEGIFLRIPAYEAFELSDAGIPLLLAGSSWLAITGWRTSRVARRLILWTLAAAALLALLLVGLQEGSPERNALERTIWLLTRRPGSVFLVAVTAFAIRRWGNEPWERSHFFRLGRALAGIWLRAVSRNASLALWAAAGCVGVIYAFAALYRHSAFETHGYDLGIFTNAIWNLTQGNGYISSVKGGINLFADHQSPLFWALAPAFWLFPAPETLLILQAIGLAAGGPALFYLSRVRFGAAHWAPAALPWVYWSYLPLRNANAFDFHPEVFMLPLLLWAFAAFEYRRRLIIGLGFIALIGALGAKESAGVVAAGIGFAWFLSGRAASRHGRWPGIALAVAGTAVFFFDLLAVPRMLGTEYAYMGHYRHFGGNLGEVLLAPVLQPAQIVSHLVDRERLRFLLWTLAPLGFLPLADWRAAFAAVPPYLMILLAQGVQRVQLGFHYGIEPGAALFWALPIGLAAFARRFGWRAAGIWMLLWALAWFGEGEFTRPRSYEQLPRSNWLAKEMLPCLDPTAPTAATDRLIPHLATREWISYPDQLRQVPSGALVSCVVTDLNLGNNWPLGRSLTERVVAELPSLGYREVLRCGEATVYQLAGSRCLHCMPKCY